MRALFAALSMLCALGAGLALAQTPLTGAAAAPPTLSPGVTPAPVPSQAPVGTARGPSVIPEQIAPGGAPSGPANATPFSGAPTGTGAALAPSAGTATPTLSK